MSYKTDRLISLFPDAYAADERGSLLARLLDAIGAELMEADESLKRLLKSHWVRYAEGSALDGLATIYGLARRRLRSGELESDAAFRRRLQSIVPLYTGGGTVAAVKGAVRSALGLPFDLADLNLPPQYRALRDEIDRLVQLTEFSPTGDRVLQGTVATVDGASELILSVTTGNIEASLPQIEWTFDRGGGRDLSVERLDDRTGFKSLPAFAIGAGQTLVFTADPGGGLSALVDGQERAAQFVNQDGTAPARMPAVPATASQWKFRARSAAWDRAVFDRNDTFDLPQFHVALSRIRLQRLTFDVEVPYFLREAVAELARRHAYPGELFVFEGIPLERIQEVVDQTRAAAVRGNVRFSLHLFETHQLDELLRGDITSRRSEDANAGDALLLTNANQQSESQDQQDRLTIVGVYDYARFDGPFGFL
jgi:hypothetical protein